MSSAASIIIAREYLERVRKKSFIITTILFPVFMLAMMVVPSLIMLWDSEDTKKFDVIDKSGVMAQALENNDEVHYCVLDVPLDIALEDESVDGVIYIPANVVKTGAGVKIYTNDALGLSTEGAIRSQLTDRIEQLRLEQYNIENLAEIMKSVECNLSLQTIRTDKGEDGETTSSLVSFILGEALNFFLYMALLLYGQMVMTSVIEEKSNRVLELIVTSVKPTRMMLGKIMGIGLVAITQIAIWMVLMVLMSTLLLPAIMPADIMQQAMAMNTGALDTAAATVDVDLLKAISMLANPWFIIGLFVNLLLYTVGGFLFYAAIFAAIGSAVDNVQDASQLSSVTVFPILFGIIFGMQAASAPNSTLAVVMSIVPLTSPMVMMSRIPFGIPSWQIVVSLVVLFASVAGMIWLAAKIYRVGIFMYGKKPTWKELVRWARYK